MLPCFPSLIENPEPATIKTMKSLLAATIIIAVFFVAAFSLYLMHRMDEHGVNCIATVARAQGVLCPPGTSEFSLLSFHLGAFKNFSTAVLSALTAAILALVLIAATNFPTLVPEQAVLSFQKSADPQSASLHKKLIHWVALHEKSPTDES